MRCEDPMNYIGDDIIVTGDISLLPRIDGPRRIDGILLMLCREGQLNYTLDGQPLSMVAGQVAIVTERHIIDQTSYSYDFDGEVVVMSIAFFYDSMRSVGDLSAIYIFSRNNPLVDLDPDSVEHFSEWIAITKERLAHRENHYRRELVRTLFVAMIYDMGDIVWQRQMAAKKKQNKPEKVFMEFMRLVEQNYTYQRHVSWYADELGLNPKYLSTLIQKASGRPPGQWIDRYVTLDIRLMLRDTRLSIGDIARRLNFANQSYLGKYFKERVGVSPSAYRTE